MAPDHRQTPRSRFEQLDDAQAVARYRWIWSRPVVQAQRPLPSGLALGLHRSAYTPTDTDKVRLAELVDVALGQPGEPWDWPRRHRLPRNRRYVGIWMASPHGSWAQAADLAELDIDPQQPWTIADTPRRRLRHFWAVAGDLIVEESGTEAMLYRDKGCEIERTLITGAIAAGEAAGLANANAHWAPWLPRALRRELRDASRAEIEEAQTPNLV